MPDRAHTFPAPRMDLTHILVVSDLERSRDWYRNVLGAELEREYGVVQPSSGSVWPGC
jgi:hypothetical protein